MMDMGFQEKVEEILKKPFEQGKYGSNARHLFSLWCSQKNGLRFVYCERLYVVCV